jgi:uncharacterized integral membrane protein (TIGR00698 family)
MTGGTKRSPLLVEEDWWTVWFGLAILLIATVLGMMALSGTISAKKVPKIGKWTASPADALYRSKKTSIELPEGTTLAGAADKINAAGAGANAEIIPDDGGFRLRVASSRTGDGETISLSALLTGGSTELQFTEIDPDPAGMGGRAYSSQTLNSPDVNVGAGKLTVTAERTSSIVLPLFVTMFFVMVLTVIGVRTMGQNAARYAEAFAVVFLLAVLSFVIANQATIHAYGLSYAAWALVLGLLVSNTVGTPGWLKPAVRTEMYIKAGLVLLGAEILFGKILSIGVPGLMVAWIVTPTVIIFMWLFGTRVLKIVSKPLVMIIAAATSVCGVSAAIAVAAASRAKKEELTLAVGMTLIFTVLMMIFMPMFIAWVDMDAVLGGAWMGGTIDSTGAVVAAGAFLGPRAEAVAAVVKMIQNILIGAVGFFVALFWITSVERDPDAPRPGLMQIWVRFPKFIVGFVAASILFSFVLTPIFSALFEGNGLKLVESSVIKTATNPLRGWFFCLAFVSIGLESNFAEMAKQLEGGKTLLLYIVGQSFNLILTLLMAWLAFSILFPDVI